MEDLLYTELPTLMVESRRRIPPAIASREFDRLELIKAHVWESRIARRIMNTQGVPIFAIYLSMENNGQHHGLSPIGLGKLQVGIRHRGRVLHGTLCVEAYRASAIATVLQDENGRCVRFRIYNSSRTVNSLEEVKRSFPVGSKVAVREPILKIALDGCVALHVYDHSYIHVSPRPCGEYTNLNYEQDLFPGRTSGIWNESKDDFIFSAENSSSCDRFPVIHEQPETLFVLIERLFEGNEFRGYSDLAQFLLKAGPEIPEFSDFVGPLEIRRSRENSGRGLFVTRDVKCGDSLITSNAIALAEAEKSKKISFVRWDTCKHLIEELVSKTLRSARTSQKNLLQINFLHDKPSADDSKISSMNVFGPMAGEEDFDESTVRHVVASNVAVNFPRFPHQNYTNSTPLGLGLWGLPSLINHSCYPNASAVYVGKVMFLFAARDISAGEEVTRSYCDSFKPLRLRDKALGFHCCCRRCIRDGFLREDLKRLEDQYVELLYQFGKSVVPLKSERCIINADFANAYLRMQNKLDIWDSEPCVEFTKFAKKLEKKIQHLKWLKKETIWWIRASFAAAYAMCEVRPYEVMVPWLITTDPSHPSTGRLALQSCLSVYGRQTQEVQQLILDNISAQNPLDFI